MPLTPRFHQLIDELNLPEAAWHLSRTNSWTESHATQEEINNWRTQILNLLHNENDCVNTVLAWVERELETIDPMDILLQKRQEETLKQWGQPIEQSNEEYGKTIRAIMRRVLLEKTRRQANLILDGGFQVIQWWAPENWTPLKQVLTIGTTEALKAAA